MYCRINVDLTMVHLTTIKNISKGSEETIFRKSTLTQ